MDLDGGRYFSLSFLCRFISSKAIAVLTEGLSLTGKSGGLRSSETVKAIRTDDALMTSIKITPHENKNNL